MKATITVDGTKTDKAPFDVNDDLAVLDNISSSKLIDIFIYIHRSDSKGLAKS